MSSVIRIMIIQTYMQTDLTGLSSELKKLIEIQCLAQFLVHIKIHLVIMVIVVIEQKRKEDVLCTVGERFQKTVTNLSLALAGSDRLTQKHLLGPLCHSFSH